LGGGQDSVAILMMTAWRPGFREKYVGADHLVTLMSATGNEHRETDDYVRTHVPDICKVANSEWYHIVPAMGFHATHWESLQAYFAHYRAIGSKAYPKSCTDKLKLVPIYRFLEDYVGRRYSFKVGRKQAFYDYRDRFGRMRVLLGISAEEATRRVADRSKEPKWARECFDKVYPLVEMKLTRSDCQEIIRSYGRPIPLPSNCMMCPFVSPVELLWLWTFRREEYDKWVKFEADKLERCKDLGKKNFGVNGLKTLPQVLEEAKVKYAGWTEKQLWDFKMTHGHGVCSKY
jgi:hypothetical protein